TSAGPRRSPVRVSGSGPVDTSAGAGPRRAAHRPLPPRPYGRPPRRHLGPGGSRAPAGLRSPVSPAPSRTPSITPRVTVRPAGDRGRVGFRGGGRPPPLASGRVAAGRGRPRGGCGGAGRAHPRAPPHRSHDP